MHTHLRYQYNPFGHPRAVRCSVRGFTTETHVNRISIGSLITTNYDPICLKRQKLPCVENVNMFAKLHEPINQGIRPRRKRLTWRPFLHTLTSKTVSQIFGTCVCYYFTRG